MATRSQPAHQLEAPSDDAWLAKLDAVLEEIRRTLIVKHHDYGSGNLLRNGLFGILVRTDDKAERVRHILGGETPRTDDSHRDAWRDIAGYAIQALVLFFPNPVEPATRPEQTWSLFPRDEVP
jgi:hypothetical protein